MKETFSIIIILFLILSCQENNKTITKLNDDGKIIEERIYDNNKNLLKVIEYYDRKPFTEYKITFKNTDFDSVVYKYDNGQIFKAGKLSSKNQVFGTWNLFDKNGNKREIREFFIYEGNPKLNRVWFLDTKGDTLAWRYEDSIFKQKEFIHDTLDVRSSSYIFLSLIRIL